MSTVAVKTLSIDGTIKEGIAIGTKNIVPIIVNVLLWALTCWIPYLNVGTTIGLMVGIVSKAAKGEMIPMTEIFDPKYRKYMGEFFLTNGLVMMGVYAGLLFFIAPGIVIAFAWSLAVLLAVDKGKNPSEALTLSNHLTYGNKLSMFVVYLIVGLALFIAMFVFSLIPGVKYLLMFATYVFGIFVMLGLQASIYKQLTAGLDGDASAQQPPLPEPLPEPTSNDAP
ncbi:MAG: hypothetical protein FWE88_09000 [Phycisphaerae bacterium]|nr:hypothetical protein [Phycisphaerae bacterium]